MIDDIYFLGDSNLNRMANQVLKKKLHKTEYGKNYYQLAISGQCSKGLAKELQNENLEESTVVLMIGTNDALKKTRFRQYEFALQSIYQQLRDKKIIFCNVLPIPRLPHPNALIRNYNEVIKSFGPYSNVTIIDAYKYFVSEENKIMEEYFEKDKLHLNISGLMKLWNLISDKI